MTIFKRYLKRISITKLVLIIVLTSIWTAVSFTSISFASCGTTYYDIGSGLQKLTDNITFDKSKLTSVAIYVSPDFPLGDFGLINSDLWIDNVSIGQENDDIVIMPVILNLASYSTGIHTIKVYWEWGNHDSGRFFPKTKTYNIEIIDTSIGSNPTPTPTPTPTPPPLPNLTIQSSGLSLKASPRNINKGEFTKLTGQLKASNGQPLSGRNIQIKANGKVIKTVTTNAYGNFSLKIRPGKNTTFQASFAGDANFSASNSSAVKVTVDKDNKKKNGKNSNKLSANKKSKNKSKTNLSAKKKRKTKKK